MIDTTHRFMHRIASIFPLDAAERRALTSLPLNRRTFSPHQNIVHESEQPGYCCLIVEGWACRSKNLQQGVRQILSFHLPGDMPDLQSLHLTVTDHAVVALTPVTAAFVRHAHIHNLIADHPRLASALWKETLFEAAIYREWITGLGRKDATARLAHLLCELFLRMQSVGLATDLSCPLPITQVDLGDALGLTSVHVNRVARQLRRQELITLDLRTLTILDWTGLVALAGFDPAYLHRTKDREPNPV